MNQTADENPLVQTDHPDNKHQYFAPAVDLALRILDLLSRYRTKASTLTEISRELEASKATCLRVLRTLQARNFVSYDPDSRRYSLGIYAAVLGSRAAEQIDYLAQLRPVLEKAADATDMTAVLVQRVGTERMMYVAKHSSESRAHVNISVGNRFPITDVSYGKWVLAYTSEEDRDQILSHGLRAMTPRTQIDQDAYLSDLDRVRRDAVLVSEEEYVPGICAISCPLFDHHGDFLAVLAVLGLANGLSTGELNRATQVIRDLGLGLRNTKLGVPRSVENTSSA